MSFLTHVSDLCNFDFFAAEAEWKKERERNDCLESRKKHVQSSKAATMLKRSGPSKVKSGFI